MSSYVPYDFGIASLFCCFGQLKQFRKGSGPQNSTDGLATSSKKLTNLPQPHVVQVCLCCGMSLCKLLM